MQQLFRSLLKLKLFHLFLGTIGTFLSIGLRRELKGIDFLSPWDCALITLVLLALVFQYKFVSSRGGKMAFQLKLIVHLILYVFTIIVVSLVKNSVFHLIAVGGISSTCFMMNAYGGGGDSSSSFFDGISGWGQNTAEPGEEINSQPSQGVGQRLPGSFEISSPGISADSIFMELEQPGGEPASQPSTARAPNEGGHEATSQPTGESSSSGSWRQYLNFSSDKEGDSAPEPSTARAPEPSTSSTWSGPWIEKWLYPEVSSSAPDAQGPRQQGELFQPTDTHQEQPPAAGPSEPRGDPSHAPVESSPSLYLSDQKFLKQFFLEEGAAVEQQQQPGVPEALPQAPAPAEDPELIKKAIIIKMKQLYPDDPWDPENPLIRGEVEPLSCFEQPVIQRILLLIRKSGS